MAPNFEAELEDAEIQLGWSMKRLARSEGHRPSIRQYGAHLDYALWLRDRDVLNWLKEHQEWAYTVTCAKALGMSKTSAKESLIRLSKRNRVQFQQHGRGYCWRAL